MRSSRLVSLFALVALIAACSDDDSSSRFRTATPTPTSTAVSMPSPGSTPTATRPVNPTATATRAEVDTPTATPTATGVEDDTPTATTTPTPTETADPARCEAMAAAALNACVQGWNEAAQGCYGTTARACPEDDAGVVAAIDEIENAVAANCPDAETVRAAGYGQLFTPDALRDRLVEACRAETASLSNRTFGGPLGVVIGSASAAARDCLGAAHQEASRVLRQSQQLYDDCIALERGGGSCDAETTQEAAGDVRDDARAQIAESCKEPLETFIAVDAATYAARAAAQARCLAATAHPDHAPLALDCGPRNGLIDTPRGQYVQVVLDSDVYGTRCGDGSPFAFWIRLAPEGEPVENVVVGMQGGGVCIFGPDCATRPADLFEALSDQPEQSGPLSNDPAINPFATWTKVYLPYCNQDVFIGGGATSNFDEITVERFGAINVRAALRYVRDVVWRELDRTTEEGYRPDLMRVMFGGFSAGGFGALYNYHYLLDDLQWAHTAAYPDASLALDNGETLGVGNLGLILIADLPPVGWAALDYLPPYCFASNCGVGPVLLQATAPRLKAVPEQQFLILSNQIDETQVGTTFFDSIPDWVNEMRAQYCATRNLQGVQYFLPAIPEDVHVISARNELYTTRAVGGQVMRDWLAGGFSDPNNVVDRVEEGTLVQAYPGVMPFDCPVSP